MQDRRRLEYSPAARSCKDEDSRPDDAPMRAPSATRAERLAEPGFRVLGVRDQLSMDLQQNAWLLEVRMTRLLAQWMIATRVVVSSQRESAWTLGHARHCSRRRRTAYRFA